MMAGRYFSAVELDQGTTNAIIGFENAEKLFGKADKAIGQEVKIKIKKQRS
jgi:hypothetical protein